jgi:hypothetical protein
MPTQFSELKMFLNEYKEFLFAFASAASLTILVVKMLLHEIKGKK